MIRLDSRENEVKNRDIPKEYFYGTFLCFWDGIFWMSWPLHLKAVTYVFFAPMGLYELFVLDAFPVVASLSPKIASANPSCKTISVTWNLLFWWWPIRSKDRIRLEWLLATSRAEVSWISASVTKYALEREFCDHNKVSCDVECWFLYKATAS